MGNWKPLIDEVETYQNKKRVIPGKIFKSGIDAYSNQKNNLDLYHRTVADELEEHVAIKGLAASLGSKVAIPAAIGFTAKDMYEGFNNASKINPYRTTGWQKTAGALDGLANSLSVGLIPKGYISNSIAPSTREQMLEGLRIQQQKDEIANWKK